MGIRRDFSWLLASRVVSMGAGLISGMLINRALAPAGRGSLAEMQAWAALFVVVFGLSLDSAIYHIADRKQYPQPVADKFITALCLVSGYAILAVGGLLLFARLAPGVFSIRSPELFWGVIALMVGTLWTATVNVFFQAEGEVPLIAKISMTQTGISAGIVGAGYFFQWLTVPLVLWILAGGQTLLLTLMMLAAWRRGLIQGSFQVKVARVMFNSGARLHLATVGTFIYAKVNQLLVNHYAGDYEAGLFAVSLNLATISSTIPQTIQTVLYPRIIHFDDEIDVTMRSVRLSLYGWGAVTLVLMIMARPILLIYGGSKFVPAAPAFQFCLAGMLFLTLSSMLAPICIKRGMFNILSLSSVLIGIFSIICNIILVPRYYSFGAAIATFLSLAFGFLISLYLLRIVKRTKSFDSK